MNKNVDSPHTEAITQEMSVPVMDSSECLSLSEILDGLEVSDCDSESDAESDNMGLKVSKDKVDLNNPAISNNNDVRKCDSLRNESKPIDGNSENFDKNGKYKSDHICIEKGESVAPYITHTPEDIEATEDILRENDEKQEFNLIGDIKLQSDSNNPSTILNENSCDAQSDIIISHGVTIGKNTDFNRFESGVPYITHTPENIATKEDMLCVNDEKHEIKLIEGIKLQSDSNNTSSILNENSCDAQSDIITLHGVTIDESTDFNQFETISVQSGSNNLQDGSNFELEGVTIDESNDCALQFSDSDISVQSELKRESEFESEIERMECDVSNIEPVTADGKDSSPLVGRKYSEGDVINQFLDNSLPDAEARLLARRAARAEAREIRMRDLERQQREQEENADRQFDMLAEPIIRRPATTSRFLSSRRSSEDSLEDTGSLRDLRHELKEVEEKFRKAMIANAQLDNDKAAQTYQLELLKDRLEELEEEHSQLKREHRDKCRDCEQLKRLSAQLKEDLAVVKAELEDRDRLILEKGLVIVGEEEEVSAEQNGDGLTNGPTKLRRALVSAENAQFLANTGEGSLDVRLAKFSKERGELQDQISHLKLELEEEKNKRRKHSGSTLNGPNYDSDYDAADVQREATKQLAEFKFRAQKAEQDVATLQATVARLESQVIRYKSAAEISEKSEEALKAEKRKLQREAREAQSRAEELEVSNTHLIKRLDKLKNAKSALLKEL